jgi:hypothetical protein
MKTIIEMINNELDAANVVQEHIGDGIDRMEEDLEAGRITAEQFAELEDYWFERLYINDNVIESIEARLNIAQSGERYA